jgi:hypothetical protein
MPRLFGSSRNRGKAADPVGDFAAGGDQVRDEALVYVERAFVFTPIPHVVTLRQHSPDVRAQA